MAEAHALDSNIVVLGHTHVALVYRRLNRGVIEERRNLAGVEV